MKKVAVIMGSDSDWPVVKAAVEQLKDFGIPYEAHILSAHRTPVEAAAYASSAGKTTLASSSAPPALAAHLAGAFCRQYHPACHWYPHEGREPLTAWTLCFPPCRCPAASR